MKSYWRPWQLTLHIQDDVRVVRDTGNLFLTNIHRVFLGDVREPSLDDNDLRDYFLAPFGSKSDGKTHRQQDRSRRDRPRNRRAGRVQRRCPPYPRSEDGLVQEHPGHPPPDAPEGRRSCLAGGRNRHAPPHQRRDLRANGLGLSAGRGHPPECRQAPGTAGCPEPRPLAGAPERDLHGAYADYLQLGIEEWRKSYAEHEALGKKAVLFVMVDDTRNCDEAGAYLEKTCPELQDAVLVIHTKNNGEISEASTGKNKDELELLRKQANAIDSSASPSSASRMPEASSSASLAFSTRRRMSSPSPRTTSPSVSRSTT